MNFTFKATTIALDRATEYEVREQAQRHLGEGLVIVSVDIGEWQPVRITRAGQVYLWEAEVSVLAVDDGDPS